jgi:hypothetical protein
MIIEKHWVVQNHTSYDESVVVNACDNESDGDSIVLTMSPSESTHFPVNSKVIITFEVQK